MPRLAQLIRANPKLAGSIPAGASDDEVESRWKMKFGEKMPWDVTGDKAPELPNPVDKVMSAASPLGDLAPFLAKYITAENAPTIGGLFGGLVGGPFGATAGAAGGEGVRQYAAGEDFDLIGMGKEGIINGVLEKFGGKLSQSMIKGGMGLYQKGAGLARNAFAQNFPTAAKEGLTAGRFGLPVLSSNAAQRAYKEVAGVPKQLIDDADAVVGKPTLTMERAVNRGAKSVLDEIGTGQPGNIGGSATPVDEAARVRDQVKEIIAQHSAPGKQVPYQTQAGHFGVTNIPPTPFEYTGAELLTKKQGLGKRAADASKAANADRWSATDARTARGAMLGAKGELEDYVLGATGKNLEQANRQVQGRMGLAQSMNPSFRSADELMNMGLTEPEALAAISNPGSSGGWLRNAAEMGAGLGIGMSTGSPVMGVGAWGAAHAVNSPLAQKMLGAGLYRGGQAAPNALRAGRFATMDPEEDALSRALRGIQF